MVSSPSACVCVLSPGNLASSHGYGRTYHGKLRDGQLVTIRRVTVPQPLNSQHVTSGDATPSANQALGDSEEWQEVCTEVRVLRTLRHRHVASLLGLCGDADAKGELAVVSVRMEVGSLEEALHPKSVGGEEQPADGVKLVFLGPPVAASCVPSHSASVPAHDFFSPFMHCPCAFPSHEPASIETARLKV